MVTKLPTLLVRGLPEAGSRIPLTLRQAPWLFQLNESDLRIMQYLGIVRIITAEEAVIHTLWWRLPEDRQCRVQAISSNEIFPPVFQVQQLCGKDNQEKSS